MGATAGVIVGLALSIGGIALSSLEIYYGAGALNDCATEKWIPRWLVGE